MPLKHTLAANYARLRAGLTAHRATFPPELVTLIAPDTIFAVGDAFIAAYEREVAARGDIGGQRDTHQREVSELRLTFDLVKNLTQAFVGERDRTRLATFLPTGLPSLIERAVTLRNALRADAGVLSSVGEQHVEELEKAIHEYEEAAALYRQTDTSLDTADSETDVAVAQLARLVTRAKLYLKAWTYDIDRPEIYAEFVAPHVVGAKTGEAKDDEVVTPA